MVYIIDRPNFGCPSFRNIEQLQSELHKENSAKKIIEIVLIEEEELKQIRELGKELSGYTVCCTSLAA